MYSVATRRLSILIVGLVISALAIHAGPSFADSITWNSPSGGNWNDALNWDPNNVPDAPSEVAVFPAEGGTFDTNLNTSVNIGGLDFLNSYATLILAGSLTVSGEGAIVENQGTIRSGGGTSLTGLVHNATEGLIEVKPGHAIYLYGPTVTNDGTMRINPDQSSTDAYLYIAAAGMTIDGSGELVLSTGGTPADANLASWYGSFYNGADHTIRGEGRVSTSLHNYGTISGDVPGRALVLVSEAKTNEGTFEATGGGTLQILNGPITQTAVGRIFANGGTVELNGASVTSGRLESAMGSAVRTTGTTYLYGITNEGEYELAGGTACYLYGPTVTNDGTMTINADATDTNTYLYIASYNLALEGSGDIVLQAPGNGANAQVADWYGSFVQGPLHTIHGSGTIGVAFSNDGLVSGDDPAGALVLSGAAKTNQGTLDSSSGGTLTISGVQITQTGAGRIVAGTGATTQLTGGARVISGGLENLGGTLETVGTTFLEGVSVAGEYDLGDGTTTYIYGASTNDGTIVVHDGGSAPNTVLYVATYGARLDGSGDLDLRASGELEDAAIYSYYGSLIQGPAHTIHGTGRIDVTLTNEGTVVADDEGGVLQLNAEAKTNKGLMAATNGGTLLLTSTNVTQDGGRFLADGGTVEIGASATVTGGSFETANDGVTSTSGTSYLHSVTNEGRLDHNAGAVVFFYENMANNGTWTVNPAGTTATTVIYTATYGGRLDGTGELVLNAVGALDNATIYSYYGNLTQGAGHTIRGRGRIATTLTNEGNVIADINGSTLRLDAEGKSNAGLFRATNGGTLEVLVTTPNSGTAEAMAGGLLRFSTPPANYASGTLTGGTWKASGGGTLRLDGCAISTLNAQVYVDGATSHFDGDGSGTAALAGLHTIQEKGFLSISGGYDLSTPGGLVSSGDIVIGPGTTLTVNGRFEHTPSAARSCRSVIDGVLAPADSVVVDGGWLVGNGMVMADVLNTCRANPGNPIGTLTIDGNYEQAGSGELYIDLAGTEEGSYDRLAVTGEARLAGTLLVDGAEGFGAQDGDSFVILTCGSRVGEFDNVFACPAPGVCMQVVYEADRVIVVGHDVAPAGIGDDGPEAILPTALHLSSRMGPSGASQLRLDLPEPSRVSLDVFDGSGRRVDLVHEGELPAGSHEFTWTGRGAGRVASGMYFVRARVETREDSRVLTTRALVVR